MQKILIIEDEIPAANRLIAMLLDHRPKWKVVQVIDSIEESISFLELNNDIDLIFMDIQLADGHSFEIFKHVEISCPVIFATAYDDYALKAFEVNGFDYLLKPLTIQNLTRAVEKYEKYSQTQKLDYSKIQSLIESQKTSKYKSRFLIKIGEQLKFVDITDIAYFIHTSGYTEIITHKNDKFLIEDSIEALSKILDPSNFFRINRKCLLHVKSIGKIHQYFNSRLKLELIPHIASEIIVSRERVKDFKAFLSN